LRIIVIGAGDVGFHIAKTLSREGHQVVVVESREDPARRVKETLDVQVVMGNGSHPEVLQQAGVGEADMLIAVTDRDEINILACLVASSQASVPTKIARVRDEHHNRALDRFDERLLRVDLRIQPEQEVADTALKLIHIPGAREVVEFAEGRILLASAIAGRESLLLGRPLEEVQAGVGEEAKILIVALRRGPQLIIPRGKDVIREGDELYVIAEKERVLPVIRSLGVVLPPTRSILLYGSSKVALYLARELEKLEISTKLICPDERVCTRLMTEFERVAVLCGEGTDQDLLLEFNVRDVDYFISASEDEEANILVALLAKRLGARRTMALVTRLSYISLVSTIGVDIVLNPQMAAIDRILRYIRRGRVLNVATVGEERAEAIEVVALETSDLVHRPLREISFPLDAIVGALVRNGNTIIPHGDTVILPGDRVIIFAKRQAIPAVEKALTLGLESA